MFNGATGLITDVRAEEHALTVTRDSPARRHSLEEGAVNGQECLGLLRIKGEVIALHALRWTDEIRSPAELAPRKVDLAEKKLEEAVFLIDSMTREEGIGGAERATGRYTEALEKVVEAKSKGKQAPRAVPEEAPEVKLVDLMAALEQSVQWARASCGEAVVHALKSKWATKKSAAKKTAPKKATAAKRTHCGSRAGAHDQAGRGGLPGHRRGAT